MAEDPKPRVKARDRAAWRRWLRTNHGKADEIWLVYMKADSGEPTVTYGESLQEAICFGWIDGKMRSIDDRCYARRFTPRRPGSKWSPRNIEIAEEMVTAGKMAKAGLAAFEARQHYDDEGLKARAKKEPELSKDLEKALRKHRKAWRNFQALTPGRRKRYVLWLETAKRQETRERRLAEAIETLERGDELGMK